MKTWSIIAITWTVLVFAGIKLSFHLDPLHHPSKEAFCSDPRVISVWPDANPDELKTFKWKEYGDPDEAGIRLSEYWFEADTPTGVLQGIVRTKKRGKVVVEEPAVKSIWTY